MCIWQRYIYLVMYPKDNRIQIVFKLKAKLFRSLCSKLNPKLFLFWDLLRDK